MFNETILTFGFNKTTVGRCISRKVSGSKFNMLVMYIDATNDLGLLLIPTDIYRIIFKMEDIREASYVIGI